MIDKHILIVEDSKLAYDSLQEKLSKENFSVAPYSPSVEIALQHIEHKRPDVVLLDINLDGKKTGIDLGKILSEKYKIPFIYVTEMADFYTFREALDTQHEQFIKKAVSPDNFEDILRAIYTVLERKKRKNKKSISEQEKLKLELEKLKLEREKLELEKERLRLEREKLKNINNENAPKQNGIEAYTDYLENLRNASSGKVSKIFVKYEDILYFTLDASLFNKKTSGKISSNYVFLKTIDGQVLMLRASLRELYDGLPEYFVKSDQKYIINLNMMEGWVNLNQIKIDGKILRITNTYREEFMKRYNEIFLAK